MTGARHLSAEAQLQIWEERFRERAVHSPYGIVVVADGQVVFVNPAGTALLKAKTDRELVGSTWLSLISRPDHERSDAALQASFDGTAPLTRSLTLIGADHSLLNVEVVTSRVTWRLASAVEITFRDTSQPRQTEGALRESEARFRALVDATSDFTFRLSADWGDLLELDGRALEPRARAIRGKQWIEEYVHPDDRVRLSDVADLATNDGQDIRLEHRIRRFGGGWRWVLSRAIPIRDERGGIVEWLGAVTDITEHKQAQEALLTAATLDRFRAALADTLRTLTEPGELQAEAGRVLRNYLNADRVCYTDVSDTGEVAETVEGGVASGNVVYPGGIDPAILQSCLAGQTTVVTDVISDSTLSSAQRKKWACLGIRAQVTVPWRKEQRLLGLMTVYQLSPRAWTEAEIVLMKETVERIGAAIGRARSESLLRASEERYRSLFNAMDDGFCVVEVMLDEPDGVIDYRYLEVNQAFERHTGLENALGRTMRSLAPEHEERWFQIYAEVARTGEPRRFQHSAAALGGRWFDVYAFRLGRPEERKVAMIFDDITERRHVEELQIELLEREHSARRAAEAATRAKDDFLAMLSHELRTPLNPVLMLASESAVDLELPKATRAHFETIRRNVELEARLIDDLLDITRITRGKLVLEMQVIDLHAVLNEAIRTVELEIKDKEITLSVTLAAKHVSIFADPVRLQQVLWNILRNAAKFTPVGGQVMVRTFDLVASGTVAVEIADSGIGMTPDEINLAFEPFTQGRHANMTAAHQFGGLGLGLAISRKLAELHQGTISASSGGIGQGSTVSLELPVLKAAQVGSTGDDQAQPRTKKRTRLEGLRILIVEDHEPTRESLKFLLERRSHVVSVAGTVADGLAALTEKEFDVLLSDLGLPDGDGRVLAVCLRERQPSAIAIALSGYGRDDDITRSAEAGFHGHIVKPIAVEKLDEAIFQAMRGGTP